jgi:hypothetical protein
MPPRPHSPPGSLIGLEEGAVALKGSRLGESIDQVLGSSLHLVIAKGPAAVLLLFPYVAFLQLSDVQGRGNLKRLFFADGSRRERS